MPSTYSLIVATTGSADPDVQQSCTMQAASLANRGQPAPAPLHIHCPACGITMSGGVCETMPKLQLVLKGIQREASQMRSAKSPVTPELLRILKWATIDIVLYHYLFSLSRSINLVLHQDGALKTSLNVIKTRDKN